MRIIGGIARGTKLYTLEGQNTRPTLDRVKESIFNLIQFDVVDAVVLDLFSGTGALGIEAISRGAKKTYLIDNNKQAISIIKENLKGIEGDFIVQQNDFLTFLNSTKEKFDIALLDPPYKTDFGKLAIEMLIKNELLSKDAIIIFETSEDKDFNFNFDGFEIKKKKYGTVAVYKMERIKWNI